MNLLGFRHLIPAIAVLFCIAAAGIDLAAIERFPRPDFSGGYSVPTPAQPQPVPSAARWIDLILLAGALALSAKFAIFDRSRKKVFVLMILSLGYFGFVRKGCVCSVGSIQNLALASFSSGYALPVEIALIFALPIIFALYFGRVFCASVCPLGAIQDIFVLKPLKLPEWLREVLRIFPYVYLGLAVLYAATASAFLICRGDHFVSIFHMAGKSEAFFAAIVVLAVGIFIARPYCRFICPYGIILSWMSPLSKWRLSVTPGKCARCGQCAINCPFEAIRAPVPRKDPEEAGKRFPRTAILAVLLPLFIAAGAFFGHMAAPALSRMNPVIGLASTISAEDRDGSTAYSQASFAFRRSGIPLENLYEEADRIGKMFSIGASALGIFIALVLYVKILRAYRANYGGNDLYEPDPSLCLNCSRCQELCPMKNVTKAASPNQINTVNPQAQTLV